jgi:hypothetical protein
MAEITKLLETQDLPLLKSILEDDSMAFDTEKLQKFISCKQNKGFIVKVKGTVVSFVYIRDFKEHIK